MIHNNNEHTKQADSFDEVSVSISEPQRNSTMLTTSGQRRTAFKAADGERTKDDLTVKL